MLYKLIDRKPVKCATAKEWADWYEAAAHTDERVVARDELDSGNVIVSTIFTGIDLETDAKAHGPRLFETMMYLKGKSTGVALRSETWPQAENQHRRMARKAREVEEDV